MVFTHSQTDPTPDAFSHFARRLAAGIVADTDGALTGPSHSPWEGWEMEKFIEEILGIDMWEGQKKIVRSVDENFATAVKSCHGSGKSYIMAAVVLAFLHTRTPSVAVTTAPTNRQVRGILWRNLRAHWRNSRKELLGSRPLQVEYNISEDHFAVGFKGADADSDSAQGYHSPHLLAVVDEAAGVAEAVIASMDNIVTGEGSRLVYIGNPTSVSGRFRDAFHKDADLYNRITISALDTPNVQAGKVVIPGLIDQHQIDRTIRTYGADSPWTRARIYAEFPDQDDNSLITLTWIENAQKRGRGDAEVVGETFRAGVDVARSGTDESVIFIRQGDLIVHRSWMQGNDNMEVVAKVQSALQDVSERYDVDPYTIDVRVDVIGVGSGVYDRLHELGYSAVDVNVSRSSSDRELHPKLREELWWNMAQRFRDGRVAFDDDAGGGLDEQTTSQLAAIRARYVSGYARPVVESKEDMKKRLGRSPDRAEALMLCLAEDYQVEPEPEALATSMGSFGLGAAKGWNARGGRRRS